MSAIDGTRAVDSMSAVDVASPAGGSGSIAAASAGGARALLAVGAAALLILSGAALGLWPLLAAVHEMWTRVYDAFEHGYLVLALSLVIGVRYWREAPPQVLKPAWPAAAALLAVIAVLVLFELMFINSARLSLLPLFLLAAIALVFGWAAAGRALWPALFLYFALPQWWAINGLLQSLTTAVVARFVALTGVPAYIEGNHVHIPSGVFEIASGCSGLNYLVTGLSLGAFYALMYLRRWRSRLLLLACATGVALVANWVRVYSLIVIGHLSEMRHYLIVVEHHLYGWILFLAAMVFVLLAARALENREAREARTAGAEGSSGSVGDAGTAGSTGNAGSTGGAGTVANATDSRDAARAGRWRVSRNACRVQGPGVVAAALVAALVLALPRVATQALEPAAGVTDAAPVGLPETTAGGAIKRSPESAWQPHFQNGHAERAAYVESGGAVVEVFRAVFPHQSADARVVRPGQGFEGPGFRQASSGTAEVSLDGKSLTVAVTEGTVQSERRVIFGWYEVAGRRAASPIAAKVAELRGLPGGRRDAAAFAVSAACAADCGAARAQLTQFLASSGVSLLSAPQPSSEEATEAQRRLGMDR